MHPVSFQTAGVEAEEAAIRAAARQLATGVAVVTWGVGEARAGLTAASVSLLSSDPATLLVALRRPSAASAPFAASRRFAVNVLGGDQRDIAEHFAGFADPAGAARFEVGGWLALADDLSCLADCAAVFECEAEETIERAVGSIVVARVRRALIGGGSGALVRWRGVYDKLGWSRDEISRAVGLAPRGQA
jgi:flavin reductase (DIM6/NTAB) family NADH-FMN oxidoreductase RutF